jgi:xanthine permease XanP
MFASATSTGGLTAILLSWLLPENPVPVEAAIAEDGELVDV